MGIFKNSEIRKQAWIYFGIIAFFSMVTGIWKGKGAGILVALCGACLCLVWRYFMKLHYQEIAVLSEQIDQILHGSEALSISICQEGELSILQSEIQKMMVRLMEQADSLEKDKVKMADAIADISHQLRTPLTAMNLNISLLSREDLSEERRIKLIRDIKNSLARIDWLIEALLKVSKIDAGTVQFRKDTLLVRDLVEKSVEPFLVRMELREIDFETEIDEETIQGDMAWNVEALGNLVKNCMEHTPSGGKIQIQARETLVFTEIVVRDTGEGFVKEDIPYLFERFYKGKNASPGSVGIGLALARSVIAAQNGTIIAENAPEGGARFVIRFYKGIL